MGKLGLYLIQSRADFFRVLDETITETAQKIAAHPDWPVLEIVMQQLMFMRGTSSAGRKPTFEERQKISMGTMMSREMESPPDLEWDDYKTKISQLSFYFKLWNTDHGLANYEKNGCEKFPDWHDLSDEPDTP